MFFDSGQYVTAWESPPFNDYDFNNKRILKDRLMHNGNIDDFVFDINLYLCFIY